MDRNSDSISLIAGDDYLFPDRNFQLHFSNDMRTNNISIQVLQDNFSELEEDFIIVLDKLLFPMNNSRQSVASEQTLGRLAFNVRRITISIQDDDSTCVWGWLRQI